MHLVFTYFHGVKGPEIMLSFPEMVSEKIQNTIMGFFETQINNPFFEVSLLEENLKITNLYFELPSEWARGKKEMVMLSVITEKDFDTENFYDLLKLTSSKITTSINIYKSLYIHDRIQERDEEITQKYEELRKIFLETLDEFATLKKKIEIMELMGSRHLSLSGAYKVFDLIVPNIISFLLLEKPVVLCGETDSSRALFNLISRIFLEISSLDEKLIIKKECIDFNTETLIVNTELGIIEDGIVSDEIQSVISRYIHEAEKTGDDDAAIIYMRQRLSLLLKVADLLERILKKKQPVKRILKDIHKHLRKKIKVDELYAIRSILIAKGKDEVVNKIIVSKLDTF